MVSLVGPEEATVDHSARRPPGEVCVSDSIVGVPTQHYPGAGDEISVVRVTTRKGAVG